MALLTNKNNEDEEAFVSDFHFPTSKKALVIFTRFPELGKCKTRLAATIGDESALQVFKALITHTDSMVKRLSVDKFVYYTEAIHKNDTWDNELYQKRLQAGEDLGARMQNAFGDLFGFGYEKVVIIGTDLYDLNTTDLEKAFTALESSNFVVGPAEDGGYYLLGMRKLKPELFRNKEWGASSVLAQTLANLEDESFVTLDVRNDIDYYEDMKDIPSLNKLVGNIQSKE